MPYSPSCDNAAERSVQRAGPSKNNLVRTSSDLTSDLFSVIVYSVVPRRLERECGLTLITTVKLFSLFISV